jgi:hypothetical protein
MDRIDLAERKTNCLNLGSFLVRQHQSEIYRAPAAGSIPEVEEVAVYGRRRDSSETWSRY